MLLRLGLLPEASEIRGALAPVLASQLAMVCSKVANTTGVRPAVTFHPTRLFAGFAAIFKGARSAYATGR